MSLSSRAIPGLSSSDVEAITADSVSNCVLDREFRRQFYPLHRDFSLYTLHAFYARKVIDLEFPVVIEVFRHDTKDKIAITCHQVAFHNLWQLQYRLSELVDSLCILTFQPYPCKDSQPHINFGRVEERYVSFYDAGFLKQLDATKARRRRQADTLGQLRILHAPIPLQYTKDLAVDLVESAHGGPPYFYFGIEFHYISIFLFFMPISFII